MFVGHYGPSMGLKHFAPKVPLWVFFLAVQWVDVLWSIFILTGVEKAHLTPGFTEASPLDLYYMPYTHSLTASITWAVLAAVVASRFYDRRGAIAVGIAVLSHWILDLPVHVADLPLYALGCGDSGRGHLYLRPLCCLLALGSTDAAPAPRRVG